MQLLLVLKRDNLGNFYRKAVWSQHWLDDAAASVSFQGFFFFMFTNDNTHLVTCLQHKHLLQSDRED